MIDDRELFERAVERFVPPERSFERLMTRRDRKHRNKRISAGVLALIVAAARTGALVRAFPTGSMPANPPEDLGIFEPVAGRIVFPNWGFDRFDRGYDAGLWAVDPNSPSVSTLVRLGPEGDLPLGWSSDGTELLFVRENPDAPYLWRKLFILHADGSETHLDTDSRYIEGATIAPDGSRVVFAAAGGPYFPYNDVDATVCSSLTPTAVGRSPSPIPRRVTACRRQPSHPTGRRSRTL